MFEFHISRQVRDKYQFEEALFSITGNVILADFFMARRFADKMNQVRQAAIYPERSVSASDIYAMGLIDEILHFMVELYRRSVKPSIMAEAYAWAQENVGEVDPTLQKFVEQFPPVAVYQGKIPETAYLRDRTTGVENTHITLEEMILLFLDKENQAFSRYLELFDDSLLEDFHRIVAGEDGLVGIVLLSFELDQTQFLPPLASGAAGDQCDLRYGGGCYEKPLRPFQPHLSVDRFPGQSGGYVAINCLSVGRIREDFESSGRHAGSFQVIDRGHH